MNALKNKKIRHEIGESESNIHVGETSQDIKKLSEDYEATKIKLKYEGSNHEISDIKIPHAYKSQQKATEIEHIKELVKKGATFVPLEYSCTQGQYVLHQRRSFVHQQHC